RLASLAKVISSWAVLVAVEEGSIALDTAIGQPGCTLRHLLCHAGGYGFDGSAPITPPQRRRIYSNTGIEMAAEAVAAATGFPFATYLFEAVFAPLGMTATELRGSPAHGMWSSVSDLAFFLGELIRPTLLAPSTVAEATSVQFPDLVGVIPGLGTFRPCPWGLGVEIHGAKSPHWMGTTNSAETFGHFGGAGTMMWVDPVARTSVVALTDRMFDEWAPEALRAWTVLSDAIVAAAR
ncbi:MAG TPA: serine hydrolase domain-containing protein, partial [Ilumatobacteraceae bacterium]